MSESQVEDTTDIVKIRKNSPTQHYLTLYNYDQLECTNLMRMLAYVIKIIRFRKLARRDNPAIVVCTSELEKVVGCKIFFFPQLSSLMKKDLVAVSNLTQIETTVITPCGKILLTKGQCSCGICRVPIVRESFVVQDKCVFLPSPYLLYFLKSVYKILPGQKVFTLDQVATVINKYIRKRRKEMCLKGNLQIIIADALLTKTVRVACFHRSQLPKLILHQLVQVWQWQINCSRFRIRRIRSNLIGTAVYVGVLVAVLRKRFIPKENEEESMEMIRLYESIMKLCKRLWILSNQARDTSPAPDFGPALVESYTNGAVPGPNSEKLSARERA